MNYEIYRGLAGLGKDAPEIFTINKEAMNNIFKEDGNESMPIIINGSVSQKSRLMLSS